MAALSIVLGTLQRSLPGRFFIYLSSSNRINLLSFSPWLVPIWFMNLSKSSWSHKTFLPLCSTWAAVPEVEMISEGTLKVFLIKLDAAQTVTTAVLLLQLSGFSFSFLQGSISSLSTLTCIFHVLTYMFAMSPDRQGNLWWKRIECSVFSMALC